MMRRVFKVGVMLGAALTVTLGLIVGLAHADGTIQWTGHGSENLPCSGGGHWVLAPAFGIDSATLVVYGTSYTMTQNGQGSWSADSAGPLGLSTTASVNFKGEGDPRDHLQLSHCLTAKAAPAKPQKKKAPTVG
jgi:hypothetical protein